MQFWFQNLINARLSSQKCLQHQADSSTRDATPIILISKDIDGDHGTEETIKTFPTMLKLISGTLVGGVKYSDLYKDSDEDEDDEDEDTSSTSSFVNDRDGKKKGNVKYQHYRKLHEKWQGLRRHNSMKNNTLHMR
jgi:hypothetical protein